MLTQVGIGIGISAIFIVMSADLVFFFSLSVGKSITQEQRQPSRNSNDGKPTTTDNGNARVSDI